MRGWALSLALVMGCGEPATPQDAGLDARRPDDADGNALDDPTLELGAGQLDWEPLSPTAVTPSELIHGPQGGYHLFGRLRSMRLPDAVQVTFRVTDLTSGRVLNNPDERITLRNGRGLSGAPGAWATSNALLIILERIMGPAEVVGHVVEIEAFVRPLNDVRAARVVRRVRVVDKT